MRRALVLILVIVAALESFGQKVTVNAVDADAALVFREIMKQTGKNFVYSSDVLEGVTVTADFKNVPLRRALYRIFYDTDIKFKIKGNDVILTRRHKKLRKAESLPASSVNPEMQIKSRLLQEVIVMSRLESSVMESNEIGAKKLTAADVAAAPVMLGESDVIKTLLMQPGVTEGTAGMAGMNVHGGNADENLYMLDNVPLYHVNHFGGLFSAFNVGAIRYVDFFKTSVPAKYDGRLSSFMDVRTKNGSPDGRHGSARLGLNIGSLNLEGPIGNRTTYMVALRRTWTDLISTPIIALTGGDDDDVDSHYHLMDLNVKVTHRFSDRATGHVSVYFGEDKLRNGSKGNVISGDNGFFNEEKNSARWGNFVAQAGLGYRFNPALRAEFTAAHTRYFSWMKRDDLLTEKRGDKETTTRSRVRNDNNINDWILRADFDFNASEVWHAGFGGSLTLHSFLPSETSRKYVFEDTTVSSRDSLSSYKSGEMNVYMENELRLGRRLTANAGLHASMFQIDGRTKWGLSPRLSFNYRVSDRVTFKGAYTRTVQYVHQLGSYYLSLPTDLWMPVTGDFKPQTADKVAAGIYWQPESGNFTVSAEGYYKKMHHLIDYCDEHYLKPVHEAWDAALTSGQGRAKGVDLKVEKLSGRLTGHVGYSLGWTDRKFRDKNGGKPYPARFDNRHTVNILVNWQVSKKMTVGAAWTGHSGNRVTLLTQMWQAPGFDGMTGLKDAPLRAGINNYRLPFYHRLDLDVTLKNNHGFWSLSFYNLYCQRNVVGVCLKRVYPGNSKVFQRVSLLPVVVPSISYTWQF